jgi:hypothetical protein
MRGVRQRALLGNASSVHMTEMGALYEGLAKYGWKTEMKA